MLWIRETFPSFPKQSAIHHLHFYVMIQKAFSLFRM